MNPIDLLKRCQGNLSQEDFAEKIGISQSLLSSIYNGQRKPSANVMLSLARVFPEVRQDVLDLFLSPEDNNRDDDNTIVMGIAQPSPCPGVDALGRA